MKYPYLTVALLVIFGIIDIAILGNHYKLTKSDWSGWVQAIGSVAALAVAIFVMSRQNRHAVRIVVNTDRRALLRRGEAVAALMFNAHQTIDIFCDELLGWLTQGALSGEIMDKLKGADKAVQEARAALAAVPLHELGSRDMVHGAVAMLESMAFICTTIEVWQAQPLQHFHRGEANNVAAHYKQHATSAMAWYQAGLDALEAADF